MNFRLVKSKTHMKMERLRSAAFVALLVTLAAPFSGVGLGQEGNSGELPQISDLQLPEYEELMKGDPYDWIVLNNDSVLVVHPVYPRPDTLDRIAKQKAELEGVRNVGTPEQRQQRREKLAELKTLEITLLEDSAQDYTLKLTEIDRIINFEHLMLQRIDALLEDRDIAKAYELLRLVEQEVPEWDETTSRFNRLLFVEIQLNLDAGDFYGAMALMDEAAGRTNDNEQLVELMASTVDQLTSDAVEGGDFRKARYFISRLSRHFPDHDVVERWSRRLLKLMRSRLAAAQESSESGDFREAARIAREANYIKKVTGNDRTAYAEHCRRHQLLRVPVRRFSTEAVVSPVPLEADLRHRRLTQVSLFEAAAAEELTYFQSSHFDVWDPQDLGREVIFSCRDTRPYWQTQPILTANQIADTLNSQLDPLFDTFNPRLASFVSRFSVRSPTQLQVSFNRVPLNLEALFRFPIHAVSEESGAVLAKGENRILSTRFELSTSGESDRSYRRVIPEPNGLTTTQYHVAEIQEHRYEDRHSEIQAFNRGDVDLLPHLFPWEIDTFKNSNLGTVKKYALPCNHVIVCNPMSPNVESPQLRRALSFGIDREKMLQVVILRDSRMKYGRVVSAPWNSESYANSPLVGKPRYDHYLSYLLRLAALEQLRIPEKQEFVAAAKERALAAGEDWDEDIFRAANADEVSAVAEHINLPVLRMVCDPGEVAMLAAKNIVERWGNLGFEVELIPADTEGEALGDSDWDLMYRVTKMEEPLLDLWSLLLTDDKFDVKRLASYPDWMRQELINLDYATSYQDAQRRLFRIHRHMSAQAFLIPLWEIDDFVIFRSNISGFKGKPMDEYDGVERWVVKP